jgi:hypothetical protein
MKSIKSIAHTEDWKYILLNITLYSFGAFKGTVLERTGKNEYEVADPEVVYFHDEFIWAEEPLFFGGK